MPPTKYNIIKLVFSSEYKNISKLHGVKTTHSKNKQKTDSLSVFYLPIPRKNEYRYGRTVFVIWMALLRFIFVHANGELERRTHIEFRSTRSGILLMEFWCHPGSQLLFQIHSLFANGRSVIYRSEPAVMQYFLGFWN